MHPNYTLSAALCAGLGARSAGGAARLRRMGRGRHGGKGIGRSRCRLGTLAARSGHGSAGGMPARGARRRRSLGNTGAPSIPRTPRLDLLITCQSSTPRVLPAFVRLR